jgi:hypothetical protein
MAEVDGAPRLRGWLLMLTTFSDERERGSYVMQTLL